MENKITSHKTKGLIISLIFIVINLIGHFAGVWLQDWFRYSILIFSVFVFIWPPLQYSKEINHNVTFGNLFAHGFKTTAVFTCLMFVYMLLSIYVLFPNSIDEIIHYQIVKAAVNGKQASAPSETQMQIARKIASTFLLAAVVVINLVIGVIGSLIGAAIAKKKPQDPFANQTI